MTAARHVVVGAEVITPLVPAAAVSVVALRFATPALALVVA